jgi:hypothetical protein
MDVFVNAVVAVMSVLALFTVFFVYVPIVVRRVRNHNDKTADDALIHSVLSKFLSAEKPGAEFVRLVNMGYFLCLKTKNHGIEFPDDKQHRSFLRYSNREVTEAMREVVADYDKFVV